MQKLLDQLRDGFTVTGRLAEDVPGFLIHHECPKTAAHSVRVGAEAVRVARLVGADEQQALAAGLLHDVSAVFPSPERAEVARTFGLEVLPEEETFPLIVHQKLSVVLARELFGVTDPVVLSAVGCHTTLKRGASQMDKLLFVADKLEWDQAGVPPYQQEVQSGLAESLDAAALAYLQWMWAQRDHLRVVHPWLREAYEEMSGQTW